MSRRRFFVPTDLIHGQTAVLPDDQAYHLRNVLRIRSGDPVEVFDGEGTGYAGEVAFCGSEVHVQGLTKIERPDDCRPRLILAQALIKSDRFEWILQKATEFGAAAIVPLKSRYCDVRIPESRLDSRMERWRRIVREAARQCCRVTVPEVHMPMDFARLRALDEFAGCRGLFLCPGASLRWKGISHNAPGYVLFIGPEGGWHPDEIEEAAKSGFERFNLGPRILRAETAALAALVLVQDQIENREMQIDKSAGPDIG